MDLETNKEEERIYKLKNLLENIRRKMNDNQEAIKQKMERILLQASTSTPSTPAEVETIGVKEERVTIKKDFVKKECKTLHHETVESEGVHKVESILPSKGIKIGKERLMKLSVSSRHI